jgi:hypothetical protein
MYGKDVALLQFWSSLRCGCWSRRPQDGRYRERRALIEVIIPNLDMSTSQRVVIIGAGIVGTNLADEVRIALELQNWH